MNFEIKKAIQINFRMSIDGVKLLDTLVEAGRKVNGIETRRTVIERLVRKEAACKDPVND